jgi:hypothetical protein
LSGSTLIDRTYGNLALRSKTLVTTNTVGDDGSYVDLTLTNCTAPEVAYRCATHGVALLFMTASGSSRTVRLVSSGGVGTEITVFHFDVPLPNPTPSGAVGRVRDSVGNLIFDIDYEYMDVVDFIAGVSIGSGASATYESGRSYAVAPARLGYDIYSQPIGGTGTGDPDIMVLIGAVGWRAIPNGIAQSDVLISGTIYPAHMAPIVTPFSAVVETTVIDVTHL